MPRLCYGIDQAPNRGFHKLKEIGTNANIGIRGVAT